MGRSWRFHCLRVCAAALAAAVFASGCGAVAMPAPAHGQGLRVLAFYDPKSETPMGAIPPLLVQNRSAVSDLAPLWYHLMADGSLRDLSTNSLKVWARKHGIALTPLVINNAGTSAFLLNAKARNAAVTGLAAMLQRENYAGLNIDFELLKPQARRGLDLFMRSLHQRMMAMHKVLTIDIIPAGRRRQAGQAYDFRGLARNSDKVVLMTYDAHDDGSTPGPVAPLAWVTKRVKLALSLGIPRSKLVVGLADYGYDWPAHSVHAATLGLQQIDAMIAARHITVQRTADGSPHFTYTVNGVQHTVWYEDARSILPKIQLARRLGVGGLAVWMVGFETAAYWHALRSAAGTQTTTSGFQPITTPLLTPVRGGKRSPSAAGTGSGSSSSSSAGAPSSSSSSAAAGAPSSVPSASAVSGASSASASSNSGGSAAPLPVRSSA